MKRDDPAFEVIIQDAEHAGMRFDVRCFLVPHREGLVLIDTGLPGAVERIGEVIGGLGAGWSDVTDVVLTHKHFDHVANVAAVAALAGQAAIWVGSEDRDGIPLDGTVRGIRSGDRVRDLRILETPGHTPGHRSLVHEPSGVLFAGDVAGTVGGVLARGPQPFTEDADAAERTLERLARAPWERMVFSHGPEIADPSGELRQLLAAPRD